MRHFSMSSIHAGWNGIIVNEPNHMIKCKKKEPKKETKISDIKFNVWNVCVSVFMMEIITEFRSRNKKFYAFVRE